MTCRVISSAAARSSICTAIAVSGISAGGWPVATTTVGTPASRNSDRMGSASHSGGGRMTPSIPPLIRWRVTSTSWSPISHFSTTICTSSRDAWSSVPSRNSLRKPWLGLL